VRLGINVGGWGVAKYFGWVLKYSKMLSFAIKSFVEVASSISQDVS
jgi:hypothetical protein